MMPNMLVKVYLLLVAAKFVGRGVSPHKNYFSVSTAAVALSDEILRLLSFSQPQPCLCYYIVVIVIADAAGSVLLSSGTCSQPLSLGGVTSRCVIGVDGDFGA